MPDNAALDMGTNARFQPALSATSDAPVLKAPAPSPTPAATDVANTPASEVNSPAAAPAPAADKKTDASAVSDDPGDDPTAGTAKHKGGFQKRIDELTKQREELRREKEEYARRLDETLKIIDRSNPPQRTDPQNRSDSEPTREQFDSPDEYSKALAEWSSKKAVEQFRAEETRKAQEEKAAGEFQKALNSWHENRAKAMQNHPDYEAVAESEDVPIAQHVGMALLHVPNGPEVAYYLGQNPAEAARISALGAPHAAIEVGRLSERLSAPSATSKAPAPTKPLSGNQNAAAEVSPDEDPNYMERRLGEMRKRK